ncbi:MAG: response regulator receiver protein [Deltaproteobacteria bacterium]|nr:response regulator receiver protein [Deltaproteobacteria bacterium]
MPLTRPKSILVVDDDEDTRTVTVLLLVKAGYHVREARDGREALDLCWSERPWLILLDCVMPFMNGPELANVLAAEPWLAPIPIVFVSATSLPATPGPNVVGRLCKPITRLDLLAMVRGVAARASRDVTGPRYAAGE